MAKHTSAWKSAEKRVAKILCGTRINGARGVQMQDVDHELFSVEVKHGKTSIPKFVSNAYAQACRNAPAGKVPLVVLHNHGSTEYMAVLPLQELARLTGFGELVEAVAESEDAEPVT